MGLQRQPRFRDRRRPRHRPRGRRRARRRRRRGERDRPERSCAADTVAAGEAPGYGTADVTDPAALAARSRPPRTLAVRSPFWWTMPARSRAAPSPRRLPRLPRHVGRSSHGRGACHAGGIAGHDRARLRPRRQHRLDRRAQGLPLCHGLLRRQARARRLDRALAAETADARRHHQRGLPGYTDTELVRDSIARVAAKTARAPTEVLAEYANDAPIGRLIRPQEVAAAVLYLCSPEAAAVTGTTLAVAGGEM